MPKERPCFWAVICTWWHRPGGGRWTLLASWPECHEYQYWDDHREQASCCCGEESDCCPVTIARVSQHCLNCGCECYILSRDFTRNVRKFGQNARIQRSKMSVQQREGVLFQQMDLSGLGGWSPQNWAATCTLLAEYHDIFSLEPGELGCTDLTKHEIKVTDDEPFKEMFKGIPPPMVDEVCSHVKEMLEVGMIHPSQSLWCNVVVLVCKKDGGLHLCINFCKLNVRTKKDLPTPTNRGSNLESSWCRILLLLGLKSWILADCNEGGFKTVHCIYCGEYSILWMWMHSIWAV